MLVKKHKTKNVGFYLSLVPRIEALVVPGSQERATPKAHDYMHTAYLLVCNYT